MHTSFYCLENISVDCVKVLENISPLKLSDNLIQCILLLCVPFALYLYKSSNLVDPTEPGCLSLDLSFF